MSKTQAKYIVLAIVVLTGIGASVWTRSYIFSNMGLSLHQRIQSLDLSGFNVRYDSIYVDWIGNTIEIDNLILEKNAYDTTCVFPEYITAGKVRAEGIGIFQIVVKNVLDLEHVQVEDLRILMRENSLMQLDSATRRQNEFTLNVESVRIKSAEFTYLDSAQCKVIVGLKTNLRLEGLELDFRLEKPFHYAARLLSFDSTEVEFPRSFYTLNILKAQMHFADGSLHVDTARVIPHVSKLEFGRKYGYEIDRYEAVIPFLKLHRFSFSLFDTSRATAALAEIQFYFKVFRDKRLPFLRTEKPMPVEMLRGLPFNLHIDSMKVIKSYVEYEEFAEGTNEAGKVFFDNLYAVLLNVDNRSHKGSMQMSANAKLLGHGDIDVFATFPFEKNRRSTVKGWIRNFDIPKINSMLTPTTQMKVESGNMKELGFAFDFNSAQSNGEIELNYENLKVVSFKEEEKKGEKKNPLKTFIMNTFIFKKNMDEDVPEDKRKGTIQYFRDDTRSIFNFWVKSLVSGIKSAYNIDKAEARQLEKDEKKEQRQERREARRAKRAERKKERG